MNSRCVVLLLLFLWPCLTVAAAPPVKPACSVAAVAQAKKLLAFHSDNDDRAEVSNAIKMLPSIRNPANPKQRFDVLEIWGYVYKGQYRMRLEYYRTRDGECVLMGQEILEHASL